jgi:drug/metabolite transporter (DMT)-like permease
MIRIAVAEISPVTLVFFRTLIGAAILLPIAAARVDMRATLRLWPWVVAFAIDEIAIPWVMLGSAEQQISSSLAGLLIAGVPLAGTAIALLSRSGHRVDRLGLAGLLLGLAGVAAIVGGNFQASGITPLLQMATVVIGYAVGPAILARPLAGLPSLAVMGLSLAVSALLYLPISLATGWPMTWPSGEVVASVVTLAVICTAAAFLVFAELIKEIGPVRATVITYVNPAVAAVTGVLILHETLTLAMVLGFALVIAGSTLATRPAPAVPASRAADAAEAV